MERHNLIRFDEGVITLEYETETLVFETQKSPKYYVGTEYIVLDGNRYFLTKKTPK